jgi:integrase
VADKFEFTYRDTTGRQIWQTARNATKVEAKAERAELVARIRLGERVERTTVTVGAVARRWVERGIGQRGRWEPSTHERNERIVRRCIDASVDPTLRPLGELKARDLTVDRVAAWSRANERVLAPSTAKLALAALNQVCRYAFRRGWMAENPVARLEPGEKPHWERKRVAILEGADLAQLLEHAGSYRSLFECLAYTGLRIGEALGLRWCDVDFDTGVFRVEQQLGRHRQPKRLKTPASRRQVILAQPVIELMRAQQSLWPDRSGDDLVFCTSSGRPYGHGHAGEAFSRTVQRAGLHSSGRLSLHSLRHSYASMLIAAGLNVVFVSRQLGHANANITLGTYAHLYAQADHFHSARAALEAGYKTLADAASDSL